jgi:hypothetical protein
MFLSGPAPNYPRHLIRCLTQLNTGFTDFTGEAKESTPDVPINLRPRFQDALIPSAGPSGCLQEGGFLVQIWRPFVQGLAANFAQTGADGKFKHASVDGSRDAFLKICSA